MLKLVMEFRKREEAGCRVDRQEETHRYSLVFLDCFSSASRPHLSLP